MHCYPQLSCHPLCPRTFPQQNSFSSQSSTFALIAWEVSSCQNARLWTSASEVQILPAFCQLWYRGEKWVEQLQIAELLCEALSSLILYYLHLLSCCSLTSATQLLCVAEWWTVCWSQIKNNTEEEKSSISYPFWLCMPLQSAIFRNAGVPWHLEEVAETDNGIQWKPFQFCPKSDVSLSYIFHPSDLLGRMNEMLCYVGIWTANHYVRL